MKDMHSTGLVYINGKLKILDQTLLPKNEVWLDCTHPEEMVGYIKRLAVRGAPLIGTAAALALGHYAKQGASNNQLRVAAQRLREARPTAVNLMAAVDQAVLSVPETALNAEFVMAEAERIFDKDVATCEAMATRAAEKIDDGDAVLTHCNSGALATAGIGTALGAIHKAWRQGKKIHVFVDETRPLLQGARLTAWELKKAGIPFTLICDNMAGFLMSRKQISKVFVGADRIAANGDFANKIGTYSVAVLARHHGLPFYVVAPRMTVDMTCPSGERIPIEQRKPAEVIGDAGLQDAAVSNFAFDVTPRSLISGIFLEDGEM